jgi:D-arginine dehydrogenase
MVHECRGFAMSDWDVIVIGAGMAGVSLGAELAASERVLVLEQEFAPAFHATGRSAAIYTEAYGSHAIRCLTRASRGAFERMQDAWRAIDVFLVGTASQRERVAQFCQDVAAQAAGVQLVEGTAWERRLPLARKGMVQSAAWDSGARELDVAAIHQQFLVRLRAAGGQLRTDSRVTALESAGNGGWSVHTPSGVLRAAIVVNAAGAWADEVARMAGLGPLGLTPRRRSVCIVEPAQSIETAGWPMTVDIDETFYFKGESGALLCSPADETPSAPCDAQPEELDLALAIDRMQSLLDVDVRRIRQRWAGLRTFAPDRNPVLGRDPRLPSFFWCAGQGGYGIQTAPAMARLGAAWFRHEATPEDILAFGLQPDHVSVGRLLDLNARAGELGNREQR